LRGNLPIFSFNHDIELGTLITFVRWLEEAFMGNNSPELPHFGSIIILLLNMIEDLIVGENFLILVIIDRAVELGLFSIAI